MRYIDAAIFKALKNLADYKPYKLTSRLTMVHKLKTEQRIYEDAIYPGAKRTGDWELTYVAQDVMELMRAYSRMRKSL
ncbi:MAG: M55 family metallopeptidase [Woeseiaceae bacterium]|nr:M55 family metallopeptidase [Woeseiaceae bacterium]